MKIAPFLIFLLTFELRLGCNTELTRKFRQRLLGKTRKGRQNLPPPRIQAPDPNANVGPDNFGPIGREFDAPVEDDEDDATDD